MIPRLKRALLATIPLTAPLYRVCKRYVDLFNGENDPDMESNGELALMKRLLPKCEVVFDVGANVGDWAERALAIKPTLDIHCFEPSTATFARLGGRGLQARLNNFALGSTAAEAPLYVFAEGAGINSLHVRTGLEAIGIATPQRTETIRIRTLDDYCAEENVTRIDFLKLDVEGHELEVLRGASRMLGGGAIEVVQFEYGGTSLDARILLKDMFAALQPHDFDLYKLTRSGVRHYPRYDQRVDNFQYQNWVAVHRRGRISL